MALDKTPLWYTFRLFGCAVDLVVLFLNPIIITVIYKDRQLKKQPSPIYIANVAFVDLCLSTVSLAHLLFSFMGLDEQLWLCTTMHGFFLSFPMASLLFMFTNSVDRFIFIKMSLKYNILMNMKVVKYVVLTVWIFSIVFPLLSYVLLSNVWRYHTCEELYHSDTNRYAHFPLYIIFLTSIVLTAIMFIAVFRVVKKSRRLRQLPSMSSLSTRQSATTDTPPTSPTQLEPIREWIPYEMDNKDQDSSDDTVFTISNAKQRQKCWRFDSMLSSSSVQEESQVSSNGQTKNNDTSSFELKVNCVPYDDSNVNIKNCQEAEQGKKTKHETIPVYDIKSMKHFQPIRDLWQERRKNQTKCYTGISGQSSPLGTQNNDVFINTDAFLENKTLLDQEMHCVHPETKCNTHCNRCTYTEEIHLMMALMKNTLMNKTTVVLKENITYCTDCSLSPRNKCSQQSLQSVTSSLGKAERRKRSFSFPPSLSALRGREKDTDQVDPDLLAQPSMNYLSSCERFPNNLPKSETILSSAHGTISSKNVDSIFSFPTLMPPFLTSSVKSQSILRPKLEFQYQDSQRQMPPQEQIFQKTVPISLNVCRENQGPKSSLTETGFDFGGLNTKDKKIHENTQAEPTVSQGIPKEDLEKTAKPVSSPPQPKSYPYKTRTISTTTTVSSTSSSPFGITCHSGRDIRTFKILYFMFCVYISLWLPSLVMRMVRDFGVDVSIEIIVIGYTLGVFNSVVNFFVYPMKIPRLRYIIKQLFKDKFKRILRYIRSFCSMDKSVKESC